MAEGTIPAPRRDINNNQLSNQWTEGTGGFSNAVQKMFGMVTVYYRRYDSNHTQVASGTFAILPDGFRPPQTTYIMAMMKLYDEAFFRPVVVTIATSGNMSISYSTNKYLEDFWIVSNFPSA